MQPYKTESKISSIRGAILAVLALAIVAVTNSGQTMAAVEQLQPTIITKIEDNDYEKLFKGTNPVTGAPNTTTNVVEPGDYLLAIAEFPDFLNAATNVNYATFSSATSMVTGLSFVQVATVTGAGTSGASFGLVPAPVAAWTANGLPAPSGGFGTIFQVYDDPIGTHLPGLTGLTTASGVTAVTDGSLEWEFGFTGTPGEFFSATTADNLPPVGPDAANITLIDSLTTFANMNLTFSSVGALELRGHDFLGFGLGKHDLQLQGNLGSGGAFPAGSYDIHTDTDAYIKVVPEPVSGVVWLLLASGTICCLGRGRKA